MGTLAEEVLASDDVEPPVAILVIGAVGTVEAPMPVLPVVVVARLSVTVFLGCIAEAARDEGALLWDVLVSVEGPAVGNWAGRLVSFR